MVSGQLHRISARTNLFERRERRAKRPGRAAPAKRSRVATANLTERRFEYVWNRKDGAAAAYEGLLAGETPEGAQPMLTPRQGCFLLALLLAGPSVSWAQAPAIPAADHYNRAVEAISAGRWIRRWTPCGRRSAPTPRTPTRISSSAMPIGSS